MSEALKIIRLSRFCMGSAQPCQIGLVLSAGREQVSQDSSASSGASEPPFVGRLDLGVPMWRGSPSLDVEGGVVGRLALCRPPCSGPQRVMPLP